MTGRWLSIESRQQEMGTTFANLLEFRVGEGEAVDSRVALENPNLSLYCLDDASRKAIFVELPPALDLTSVPFVNYTQRVEALRLLEVPFESFVELAAELPEIDHLIMLHNTGRSGSTLLSQVFSRVESVYSLAEADAPVIFPNLWESGSDRDAELKALLDSSMRFLFRPAASSGASIFAMKPRNTAVNVMGLFQACYPGAKNLFLYRSALGFVGSFIRIIKRFGAPDHEDLNKRQAKIKDAWNLEAAPLTKYLDEGAELVPITQTLTLWWLSIMERYIDWHEQGIPALAVRYEDLNAHREEVLSRVFEYCDLPVSEVQKALGAFSKDAQEGTGLERERPDEKHLRLSEEQVDEVVRVLARHPVINTPDFLAPGTLNL